MSFLAGPSKPPRPPNTPSRADASVLAAGERGFKPYQSMVNTGSQSGLTRKADGMKRSIIGGAQ